MFDYLQLHNTSAMIVVYVMCFNQYKQGVIVMAESKRAAKLLEALSNTSDVVSADPGGLTIKTAAAFADVPETTIRHWLKTVEEFKAPNAVTIWQPDGTDVKIVKISRVAFTSYLDRKTNTRGRGRRGQKMYKISVPDTQFEAIKSLLADQNIELQPVTSQRKPKADTVPTNEQTPVASDLFDLPLEEATA